MSDILDISQHGRVLRLALNRPDRHNALSASLCRELLEALNSADRDQRIGAVVLTGNGDTFCSGMDLKEFGSVPIEILTNLHEQLFTLNMRLSTPLIAAVNGVAMGGGMGLVANCHIVVASGQAKFGLTEIKLGLWPLLVFSAVQIAVGERRTVELAITGRTFGAEEAHGMGLVHEISGDSNQRAMEIAESISLSSPTAIQSGLDFVQEIRGKDWETAGRVARRVREERFRSPDFLEGIRAFREKRKANWPSIGVE